MRFRRSNARGREGARVPGATIAAEARAKRARDHLARKRRQERQRLQRERGRAESANSRARMRGLLTPALFLLAFASGLALASTLAETLLYRGASLERVAVQGASTLTPDAIVQSLGVGEGRSLDMMDEARIRAAIKSEPWIESIRSLRLPNGTLIVSVVEREAVARWRTNESGHIALIDDHGERFSARIEPGGPLPLVMGTIDEESALPPSAIEILEELRHHAVLTNDASALTLHLPTSHDTRLDVATEAMPNTPSGYILELGEGGPRALLGKNFLQQRIARLAALLESKESRLKHARLIDLRYADRAILRTEPASG